MFRQLIFGTAALALTGLLTACQSDPPVPPSAPVALSSIPPATLSGAPATLSGAPTTAAAVSATSPAAKCGHNLSAPAVRNAIAAQPPVQNDSGAPWNWAGTPVEGNFDPCRTLSAALIIIESGTASSPMQILLFHQGSYLGTGTLKWRSFIGMDPTRTTDDTVAVKYHLPGTCDACSDGADYCVQYHWTGSKVDMIGTPPDESSTGTEIPGSTRC
ncbi:LppP/LprE family lipoprotein [Nocardia sp. NBC_01388]|uniref:LppP/LprE family lipoprotein n=1 Tax=Nocardia sp. NBC_01388 TaxID=2903596 RepID=UPI00324C7DF1